MVTNNNLEISKVASEFERWGWTFCSAKISTKFEFLRVLFVVLNGAAVDVNKNLVKILAEQDVRPRHLASDATLAILNSSMNWPLRNSIYVQEINVIRSDYCWKWPIFRGNFCANPPPISANQSMLNEAMHWLSV